MLHLLQCIDVTVPPATDEALRFYHSGNLLWIASQLWSFLIPLVILFSGFSAKLELFSKKIGKNWYFTILVYVIFFVLLYSILSFPIDYVSSYLRPYEYGLSSQTFGRWISKHFLSFSIGIITTALFLWIFYLLIKKSPKRWWLYCSLVSVGIAFVMMFVQPIWIDPLFNKFTPMENKELEQQIHQLAHRAGIEHERIFEVDKSADTKLVNAYVTGFGNTKRIVLWDTILKKLKTEELLFVVGHEMGHYVLGHVWMMLAIFTLFSFVSFYLLYRLGTFLLIKYKDLFGFEHLYHIASLPLLLVLFSLFSFLATPVFNAVSRTMERQADQFGLEITQNSKAAANAFLALQEENLVNPYPGPIYNIFRSSHPSLGERIEFIKQYCPWSDGQPLKYAKHFIDIPNFERGLKKKVGSKA